VRNNGYAVIIDDRIERQPEVYPESGDHEALIHMSRAIRGTERASDAWFFSTHE